jgi:hypothetical protein
LENQTNNKTEVKRGTLVAVGSKVEDLIDSAEARAHEARGAKTAIRAHVKNLLAISTAADQEVGKSIPDLETLKLVKEWLGKAIAATDNLAGHLENVELQIRGEVVGQKAIHDHIQKMVKMIDGTEERIKEAITSGEVVAAKGGLETAPGARRMMGVHPGSTIKTQRLAEEKAASSTKKTPRKKKTARKKAKTSNSAADA